MSNVGFARCAVRSAGLTWLLVTESACGGALPEGMVQLGRLQSPYLNESSGLAPSTRSPGTFWTHNDGKRPQLFAISRDGASLAEFNVLGASLVDWEDLATDSAGQLFIGDLGNNEERRTQLAVYAVDEPELSKSPRIVSVKRGWTLLFPGKPFDCESLFIWQTNGYVISKLKGDRRAELYRFPLSGAPRVTLERTGELRLDSPVTGAAISTGGNCLAVVAKNGAYLFQISGNPANAAHQKPLHIRFKDIQVEACCFAADGLMATAESREVFLFTHEAIRGCQ